MSLEKLPIDTNQATCSNNLDTNNSTSNSSLNSNKTRKPQTKETSSLINDEFCNYCDEGGSLINCDRCPASFHLLCHDPPLDNDQIPKGEFLCNKCKSHSKIGIQPTETSSKSAHFIKYDNDSPLDILCRMAESFNPREMNLSTDLTLKCEFSIPGMNRIKWFSNEYKLSTKPSVNKEDNPTSKKLMCQACSKLETCNNNKKVTKCDFCESVFHHDCLFMLIGEIPIKEKIWMCPLHSEHILNLKYLKTEKLSDKINLWNRFQLSDEQDEVERQFLLKCKSKTINSVFYEPVIKQPTQIPKEIKNIYSKSSNTIEKKPCFEDMLIACEALQLLSSSVIQSCDDIKIKIPSLDKNDLVRPKAVLKYISDTSQDLFESPISLVRSSTTIGNSIKADVCLRNDFVQCSHLSDKHATIFYDYLTNRFELLNYSDFGTQVDNCMLGFDLEDEDCEKFWEGPIELKHGSLIRIGCFKFVFVIIDYEFRFDLNVNKFDNGNCKRLRGSLK